jgi:hypothetical protein
MLHLKNLSDKYQKRTLRVDYGQTQATPWDLGLDPNLRAADGSIIIPSSSTTNPLTYSASTFSLKNGMIPGTVMVLTDGTYAAPHPGGNSAIRPFGLLANFIGGNIDDLGDENRIGVWRGVGSSYTVLAPAFKDDGGDGTALSAAYASAKNTGIPVKLYAHTDGRLTNYTTPGSRVAVANLVEYVSSSRIVIDLLV